LKCSKIGSSTETMNIEHKPRVPLFGFNFDNVTLEQAAHRVLEFAEGTDCGHYVVTPNLDHAVILHKRPELKTVYDAASLVVADGFPMVLAAQWLRRPLSERVAGSDLVPKVLQCANRLLRVFLLGAASGVAQRAAQNIEAQFSNIRVVGVHSPPVGFELDQETNDTAVTLVAESAPDILVVGLGAPKQEIWSHRERARLRSKVILCAGATIDFLAGERPRAPEWCQRQGLEWAYRCWTEPRRLIPRYAEDAAMFPRLLVKQWLVDAGRISGSRR
jgi:N-acetylglucosaminyldiphosphoundecaprenol N-acetyl-beta-D-mannosaminyltransferase